MTATDIIAAIDIALFIGAALAVAAIVQVAATVFDAWREDRIRQQRRKNRRVRA